MAVVTAWAPGTPLGSDDPRALDTFIQALKTGLGERLLNGGHKFPTGGSTTDTEDGRHTCGVEQSSGGVGSPLAGEFYIYANDSSTRIVTVSDSSAASPNRFLADTLNARFESVTADNGLTVTAGGATITAGGLVVTAGGLTVSAGTVALPSGQIGSLELATESTSKGGFGSTALGAGLTGAYVSAQSVVYTTSATTTGDVLIIANANPFCTTAAGLISVDYRLTRDGVSIFGSPSTWGVNLNDGAAAVQQLTNVSLVFVDTGRAASTAYTYALEFRRTTGSGGNVADASLLVREFMR